MLENLEMHYRIVESSNLNALTGFWCNCQTQNTIDYKICNVIYIIIFGTTHDNIWKQMPLLTTLLWVTSDCFFTAPNVSELLCDWTSRMLGALTHISFKLICTYRIADKVIFANTEHTFCESCIILLLCFGYFHYK